jgi:hypothetical protein
MSDVLMAVDRGDVAALVLLDLSAAFDTVDHVIMIERLRRSFGIGSVALSWFQSYLADRVEYVRRGSQRSTARLVASGVPQGSVLGPILFILYAADLAAIVRSHHLCPHLYADDTQIYGTCPPSESGALIVKLRQCIDEVAEWMRSNRLQLNTGKTEFMWLATGRRLARLELEPLQVGADLIAPSSSVRNLGIYIDADLSMSTHVSRTVSRCFAVLRQLRSVSRSVPRHVLQTLVVSLVISRLDYGNAVLAGLPAYQLRRLQSVLNAAARLVFGLRGSDHISSSLASLHWLRVRERIQYKIAVLTYRAQNGLAPRYLADDIHRVADIESRRRLRSSHSNRLTAPVCRLALSSAAFPVAAPGVWNALPEHVTSSPSLDLFKSRLKTFLFGRSFPS